MRTKRTAAAAEPTPLSVGNQVRRALRPCGRWPGTKDELLDAVFWLRQLLSVGAGVALGVVGVTGFPGFLVYIASTTLACVLYARFFLGGADVLEGTEALSEGLLGSLGFFFISWVLSYSLCYH